MQHNQTKVTLSKDELELVTNAQILLTKNEIIKKVYKLFGQLSEKFVETAHEILPNEVIAVAPKISRGENYEGLPYVMLDYPRYYKKEEAFGIRTFFWWGNFISITLQLAGNYKTRYIASIKKAVDDNRLNDWYICNANNEWQHHFRENNYALLQQESISQEKHFIKLAIKIPLEEWDHIEFFLLEKFSVLIEILKD